MTDEELQAHLKAACRAPLPHQRVKATRGQWGLLATVIPRAPARQPWEPDWAFLTGVPVDIVRDVEETTPWLRKWAEQRLRTWPCQRIVESYESRWARWRRRLRRRPPEWVTCGLFQWHAGHCLPHVAGGYLRPPIIHPLDLPFLPLPMWRWRCPEGCPTSTVRGHGPTHDMHYDGTSWALNDVAVEVQFSPCGHTFRAICPPAAGHNGTEQIDLQEPTE